MSSSTHHMSKKTKLNDNTPSKVMFEYSGQDVPENVTHVRFHPSVTKIGKEGAFEERTELREVVLNDGLREIGESAFCGCIALQSINMPSTVTKIGKYAFLNCSSLVEVVLSEGLTELGTCAFQDCKLLQSITIPSTATEISYSAFIGCTNLREVVLSDGLKKIEDSVFQECTSLQSITIPSTVDEIGNLAFSYCTNLRDVVFNNGIKMIGQSAFQGCSSLERITIPSTVDEIGSSAFRGCSSLREIVIHDEGVQKIGDTVFTNCTSLERFKLPSLSTRLDNIIQAGQRDIEPKMNGIPTVEWRSGELSIPAIRREIEDEWGIEMETVVEIDKENLDKIVRLIRYYEIKEATTLFELALWKAEIDQADILNADREACHIDVPGPVKDNILQYLQ